MEYQKLIDAALRGGATKATVIPENHIVTSPVFREICETNQCGGFGRCWMCPPFIGPVNELIEKVHSFKKGLLYQTVYEIEDSYDIEGMFEAGKKHALVCQSIDEEAKEFLPKGYLHLGAGGCHLCETCAKKTDEPCRFPDKAISSLEGYGIDVFNTAKDTGLKYINGQNTVTYFGMILFTE